MELSTPAYKAEVTGWNSDGESVEGHGYGDTEDVAVIAACAKWGIIEIGDCHITKGEW